MILEGNERGYGAKLAEHLMNPRDNDHVTVHAVDGFMADYLQGAFAEVEAIAEATQCSKYLFSLSLNPPPGESVSVSDFEEAIADVEKKLGLVGQPKAVVFHEKEGRRHAHCVWSRIDVSTMTAINLSHYKRKLGDVTRELFRRHKWEMPEGLHDQAKRDPLNVSREEAQQAKRLKRDRKELKELFQRCWERSDDLASFKAALKEEGFLLAQGDRRGFVAIDGDGKVWSLSRWCGVSTKDMRARLGDPEQLSSVDQVLGRVADLPKPKKQKTDPAFELKRTKLIAKQRKERADLIRSQEQRRSADLKARRAKLPKGLRGVFARITGHYQDLLQSFEEDTAVCKQRYRDEQQALIDKHLAERRALIREARQAGLAKTFNSSIERDPRQVLELPKDDLPFTQDELLRKPELIFDHISKTKAQFERTDVLRELAKQIDDPFLLKDCADKALRSSGAVLVKNGQTPVYTTQDYLEAEALLQSVSQEMARTTGYGVSNQYITHAIRQQNAAMKRSFGGKLSDEQSAALDHILGDKQIACVVGLAGAGKSTLLKTAMDAWSKQGIKVHGAALAGIAADGLEEASDIQSRTLASLEVSWENGYEPISKGDVLVIDEAGMIGTRQLARIASKMKDIGAKLVLVGDPDQLQPIEAGTPFSELTKSINSAKLTEIHRQRDNWQKQASRNLADGNITDALEDYTKHKCVHSAQAHDDAIEALVEAYVMDTEANGDQLSRLALAHRRKDVHALNQAIRRTLKQNNEHPEPEVLLQTEMGKRAFAKGDRIVFGRNDRDIGVKNGMLGTVQSVDAEKIVVTIDGDPRRKLIFNPKQYSSFDHGYAVTIHKSQGATVDNAYVLASRSMDKHLAYVAMTRHRDEMRLYINERDRPAWSHGMERNERSQKRNQVKRSGPSMG